MFSAGPGRRRVFILLNQHFFTSLPIARASPLGRKFGDVGRP